MTLAAAAVALACTLADPRVAESSGAARLPSPGWIVTANDSGGRAELYALDHTCRTAATITVRGATNVDWEDLAAGPDGSIWIGDIGDNRARRDAVVLYRVHLPSPLRPTTVDAQAIALRYDDGPHDAETLLVDHEGTPFVVTKDLLGRSGVYRADVTKGVLRRVASVSFTPTGTAGGPDIGAIAQLTATGGSVSPDGTKVAIRTYTDLYEWHVPAAGVAAAFTSRPTRTALPETHQGEAVAYVTDDELVLTSEGESAPVHVVPSALRPAAATSTTPITATGRGSGRTTATSTPRTGSDPDGTPPWVLVALGVTVVAGVVVLSRRRGD